MIPCNTSSEHPPNWKKLFADSYINANQLQQQFPNLIADVTRLEEINKLFPIQLTRRFIRSHPIDGAVLRQYLPSEQELTDIPEDTINPVGDIEATQIPGVIKKYHQRALLIASNTCPIHCRYCFRKNFPYPNTSPHQHMFKQALDFFAQDKSINEVILSGGDPLSLEDSLLDYLFQSIEKISHIKTIRLHTKYPSIFPERITQELLNTLKKTSLNKVCVFHINHPNEVTDKFCEIVHEIKQTDTITLNQSVLLKQVNDNADVLTELSRKLFDAGVLPYYLHMLDHTKGTHHFRVSRQRAQAIINSMKNQLPGYLVPKLAEEIAGESSKTY